jgi:hypothetical protein
MQTPRYMHHEVSEYERREVVRTDSTSHTCPQPSTGRCRCAWARSPSSIVGGMIWDTLRRSTNVCLSLESSPRVVSPEPMSALSSTIYSTWRWMES